jgi:hypothetical protein
MPEVASSRAAQRLDHVLPDRLGIVVGEVHRRGIAAVSLVADDHGDRVLVLGGRRGEGGCQAEEDG